MTAVLTRRYLMVCAAAATLSSFPATGAFGADVQPHARMLRHPDVSATHIAFAYANDLWIVPRAGGAARPLASPEGIEGVPRFSPDGQTIAFIANYDGNDDIYTLPVDGGVPFRVTYHPTLERLYDWTSDGRLSFFAPGMGAHPQVNQLYTVSPEGAMPEQLPVPYGTNGSISDDGQWLAYTPYSRDSRTWKRYMGGMASDIWLFHLTRHESKKITDWGGTDSMPMWFGDKVYYVSDAGPNHRKNIWVYETKTGNNRQITKFSDYDVNLPAMGPGPNGKGEVVFQCGADIYLLDLQTEQHNAVEVVIPGDRPKIREQTLDASDNITAADISPSGKRVVVAARGDIWTLPEKHGRPRNLTHTNGVGERDPSWSPDKRWIAYFSDATGEYELYITQSDGKGETKQLTDNGKTFRNDPVWSPDSKHIAFSDKTGAAFLCTIESKELKPLDVDEIGGSLDDLSWSHDSRWIAYTKENPNRLRSVWVYNVESGEKHKLTSDAFNDSSPTFDRNGDYLFYASSASFSSPIYEDGGPTFVYTGTEVIHAVPLRADMEYVWAPKIDEESWDDEAKADDGDADADEDNGDDEDADADNGDDNKDGDADDADDGDEGDKDGDDSKEAVDDGVSGVWEGTIKGGDDFPPEGLPLTITLRLSDGSVSGSMSAGPYVGRITDGKYDKASGELSFTIEVETEEGAQSFGVTATISGESISGNVSGEDFSASFTATRTSSETPDDDDEDKDKKDKKKREKVEIDLEGFEQRALRLPIGRGRYGGLAVNDKNHLIYADFGSRGSGDSASIKIFDLEDEDREEKTVATGSGSFGISADGKKLLVATGGSFAIIDAKAGQKLDKKISTDDMNVRVDPRAEWKQLFHEAWRIYRDYFYDPHMHGVDWDAVREQYGKMLDDCASREDVSFLIREMISELNVGHAYYFGGVSESGPTVSVGVLGCDFELDGGAYRIAKIYEGAPWDSDARGPLSQPGVDVKAGDYLLAIDGVKLDPTKAPWAAFQDLAGQTVTLTVNEKPEIDDDAREVNIKLADDDENLRYRGWIESNRAYVDEKSGGKVGYIYVPDTGGSGQSDLFRQFYGQIDKQALIIDERWNGGGQIPSRFVELLNRPITNYFAVRDGQDGPTPDRAHFGPKCMLINGLAGSGGDMFPALFRQAGLGKLIGTRTWGGLVGLSGNPSLIDGAAVLVPRFAYYELDGTWGIEGYGVAPDIEVVDDPAKMVDGGDPQLDAAIEHMLTELKTNAYKPPQRPAYPDRSGMGIKDEDR